MKSIKNVLFVILFSIIIIPFYVKAEGYDGYQLVSGDLDTIGSIVKIENEEFYVIGKEDDYHIKLLSKYNLGAGIGFDTPTNKQDETAKGWCEGCPMPAKGAIAFASTSYWAEDIPSTEKYVYNENSLLYPHVQNYVSFLNEQDVKVTGRLMSKKDLEDLVNDGNHLDGGHLTDTASNIEGKEWVFATSYWLGSAYLNDYVWMIASESNTTTWAWGVDVTWGIRPVIVLELEQPQEEDPVVPEEENNKEDEKKEEKQEYKNPQTGAFISITLLIILIICSLIVVVWTLRKNKFRKI